MMRRLGLELDPDGCFGNNGEEGLKVCSPCLTYIRISLFTSHDQVRSATRSGSDAFACTLSTSCDPGHAPPLVLSSAIVRHWPESHVRRRKHKKDEERVMFREVVKAEEEKRSGEREGRVRAWVHAGVSERGVRTGSGDLHAEVKQPSVRRGGTVPCMHATKRKAEMRGHTLNEDAFSTHDLLVSSWS